VRVAIATASRFAVVMMVAACGTSGPGQAPKPPTASATPTTPAPPSSRKIRIEIKGFQFRPRTVRVAPGTRISWVDLDASNHTVTFTRGPGDLGNVDPERQVSARFTSRGRYLYVCQYHPNMRASVIVR
jgi:plastocyanin